LILALSSTGDLTTDYVIQALVAQSHDVVRVNTDTLLKDWTWSCTADGVSMASAARSFCSEDVTAVYYRRARRPLPHPETHPDARFFAYREARIALRGLYSRLRCEWISHFLAVTAAENRLAQMYLAQEVGFAVPAWISTNIPNEARSFFRNHKKVVTKPLSYGALGNGDIVHTSLVSNWDDAFAEDIRICPILLQSFVEKRCDYRVTVIDNSVFACRIDSQANDAYAIDMRRGLMDMGMVHDACYLPAKVEKLCVQIVLRLGLRFGAIDLVQDGNGVMWFLEVNPTGQWAWIEDRTGLPIAEALAKALAND
jgi:glutathione synthase/RimK-type ligase-like ATP-grasp enzyme